MRLYHCPACVAVNGRYPWETHLANGSPEWADAWEAHFGRANLDARTLINLDQIRCAAVAS